MLKRVWGVSLFSTVCLWSGMTLLSAAQAATPDYSCYMQVGSSQVVDLTRSVCGFSSGKFATSAAMNSAYLNAAKKLVGQDERAIDLINGNPEVMIAAAQSYCTAREAGVSDQQFVESQYQELAKTTSESAGVTNDQQYETVYMASAMAVELAPKHYCAGGASI